MPSHKKAEIMKNGLGEAEEEEQLVLLAGRWTVGLKTSTQLLLHMGKDIVAIDRP